MVISLRRVRCVRCDQQDVHRLAQHTLALRGPLPCSFPSKRTSILLAIGILCAAIASNQVYVRAEFDPRIEALGLETRQWAQSVNFTCTFRHDTGRSSSPERGLALDWIEDSTRQGGRGVLSKGGSMIRHSYQYDQEAVFTDHGDYTTGLFASFEEVFTPQWLIFNSLDSPDKPSLVLSRREPYQQGETPVASQRFRGLLNPLSINSRPAGDVLSIPGDAMNVKGDIEPLGDSRLHVTVTYATKAYTADLRLMFWTEPDLSVIERCEWTYVGSDGSRYHRVEHRSNFVQCDGGLVPSSIVTVSQSGSGADGVWRTGRWHSADLREGSLADGAFVIELSEGTHVINLRDAHNACAAGLLDCTQVSLEDFSPGARFVFEQQPSADSQQQIPRFWGRTMLLILGIVILIGIFIGATRWRRVKQ